MEILKRKIQSKRQDNQDEMSVSLINGSRLCCRWHKKAEKEEPKADKSNLEKEFSKAETKMRLARLGIERKKEKKEEETEGEDMLINFTEKETEKIKKIFRIKNNCDC